MTWLGPEAIIDATVAYIQASQTAKLASIAARFTTTMPVATLPDFQVIRASDPDFALEAVFPALFVSPDTSELELGMGGTVAQDVSRFVFTVMPWGLPTTALTNAEVVRRLSMRYALAVLEMLLDMHSHTVSTYHVNGGPLHWGSDGRSPLIYYSPIFTRGNEYLGDARLIIGVEHTEA